MGLPAVSVAAGEGRTVGNERTYPVPAVDGVIVDRAGVLVARTGGRIVAMSLACPHQHAAVRWLAAEQRFECSKHHSKYEPTGVYTSGRATRNLDRFPIRRDATTLYVDMSRVFESDKDRAAWNGASVEA
jgi:Rieske Fe-S protein